MNANKPPASCATNAKSRVIWRVIVPKLLRMMTTELATTAASQDIFLAIVPSLVLTEIRTCAIGLLIKSKF